MGRLILAPMEGLADYVLRDVLTKAGGFDLAVTEFVRVSGSVLPNRTFERRCPELNHGCLTKAGTPVVVQLLGSDPTFLAANAARLAELNPIGIDLNFGCPAPTVNRHGGGAMLLAYPKLLNEIVSAVRAATPVPIPVSAKMRLGINDTSKAIECAKALEEGGAASLVVHARTKQQGYRPPAYWEWIAQIRESISIPVIANGEVWTVEDYARCREVSGSVDVMLGRGAVADPFLARRIKNQQGAIDQNEWHDVLPLVADFWVQICERVELRHAPGRLKLWLSWLRKTYQQADQLYGQARTVTTVQGIEALLCAHGVQLLGHRVSHGASHVR